MTMYDIYCTQKMSIYLKSLIFFIVFGKFVLFFFYFYFYFLTLQYCIGLPYINMNQTQVYTCSPSWTLLPLPSPYHPSGSSQCTSPKHPVSCIEPGLVTHFIYDIIHVSMPFSQIISPSPSPTESKRLFYTSVSLLLSRIQDYCYHLSKFHIYVRQQKLRAGALGWTWGMGWGGSRMGSLLPYF